MGKAVAGKKLGLFEFKSTVHEARRCFVKVNHVVN